MTPDAVSQTFSALADPTRRAIIARLALGEATVNELAEPFDISLPGISKHLKVLEGAGLVSRSRDAQRRPVKLETAPLIEAQEWIERYRAMWERRFLALDDLLDEMQGKPPRAKKITKSPKPSNKRKTRH